MTAVSDSTPLIHPVAIGDLPLLRALFPRLLVPEEVWHEVVVQGKDLPGAAEVGAAAAGWIEMASVRLQERADHLQQEYDLDAGEAAAITLTQERQADLILMDDQRAVTVARRLGLEVLRTPGLYRLAKARGLIEAVRPRLDRLRQFGFWLSDRDRDRVLREAGE